MKTLVKILIILFLTLICVGCSNSNETIRGKDDVLLIKENLFIAQCNDVYANPNDYLDKTIRYEGIYTLVKNPNSDKIHKIVIRNGPGCCVGDGQVGFEVDFEGDLPKANDWVEVEGKVEKYVDENGFENIKLKLDSIEVLNERGSESVVH